MQNHAIAGIDISNLTLDICILKDGKHQSFIINNQVKDIRKFFGTYKNEQVLIAMENTGRYNWSLYEALSTLQHKVYVISPLHIKKSAGLIRGKNDKIDALRIALFIEKHHAGLPQWKPAPVAIEKLKVLLTERSYRMKVKRQLLVQRADHAKMKRLDLDKPMRKLNDQMIELILKQVKQIEAAIQELIKADEQLNKQATLICSVPGVGKVLCWTILAKTAGFTLITEPRKMACYSGVVPFEYQSGSSIKGKSRVSHYADKALKTILHLAAMSAIRLQNDLGDYYRRKVAQGKNKMSVINAVRNKIIHRIFAVIKNQTTYQSRLLIS
ncbi:MAG: IS110 family transposase [Chryseobacterium sp.]|nr:MAG: IS110 family transposase [Chryseobacterium sp.]